MWHTTSLCPAALSRLDSSTEKATMQSLPNRAISRGDLGSRNLPRDVSHWECAQSGVGGI
eukprot:CAMPEP_0174949672 /NCGR_PEP_ID=MMETSP1355-20121228/92073_1 /TAXON_ID=464990 /ORGANISM="Hemiselmis tepida, Strain CCMP443" /LENGTH=59 /DNA_ID=CAMNT_0016197237 /DNA_START=167 /DNA_END=343 /DNA_ORIENTATION=+